MFILQKQSLGWVLVSVCAVWILGCSEDNSLSAALSKKFVPDTAPTGVSAKASLSSSSSITVSWSPVPGAIGYRVYRSTSSSGNYTIVGNTSSTSYKDDSLSSGTPYYYKVSACNGSGESPKSTICDATTGLDVPINVSAVSTSASSITVSWSSVRGAARYRVYRKMDSSDDNYKMITTVSSTSFTDDGLLPGTTYYYKISAYNGTVESSQSSPPAQATTGLNPPATVFVASTSSNSITVEWSSVSGAMGYRVYRSTTDTPDSYIKVSGDILKPDTSYKDNNVLPGTTYYYKVSAYNNVESVKSSSTAQATTDLDAPTNVIASTVSSTSISVSWSAVNGAVEYKVYRSTNASSGYIQVGSGTSKTSITDNGLSPGTTYYYKVSAYNSNAESPQSSPSNPATTRLDAPTNVFATASSSSITVTWQAVSGATGYRVYRSTYCCGGDYTDFAGTATSATYTDGRGLSPGITYYYKVSATKGAVESEQSSLYGSAKIDTPPPPPDEED